LVKRRGKASTYTTDKSAASWYPNRVNKPEYQRSRAKFPMNYDRKAESNVPFSDETLHRTWGGKAPTIPLGRDELSTKLAKPLDSTEYLYVNNATDSLKLEPGYIATSSGIEPLEDEPFTPGPQQGYPLDVAGEITNEFENDNYNPATAEFWYTKFPDPQFQFTQRYPYTPIVPDAQFLIRWQSDGYMSPTEPQIRYPKGGYKLRKTKY
jgi:hypothetical protein